MLGQPDLTAADSTAADLTAVGLLQAEAAQRDAFADALHDGPMQALLVARYAADAVVRGADPTVAREAVQEAVVQLRRALWHARPRGTPDLAAALEQLSERLGEGGHWPLLLEVDPVACRQLSATAATTAYGVVQAAGLATAAGPLSVSVRQERDQVVLALSEVSPALPHWEVRLHALGATTVVAPEAVLITFPTAPRSAVATDPKVT